MDNFFAELKRRHIYRVAAAYAVVAWVLLQLVNNVAPILDLPPWVARAFLLLLVIGFPAALFFAWMRELAPADGATARATTGKLDWVLIGALVAVLAGVSYQQLAPATGAKSAQQAGVATAASPTSPAQPGGISIAVLPFVNLSSDKEQEFFSDGMTEEITAALAKVPSLRVVGRTSAFEFKGQNKDLRAIGQALGASHLIEGSVRKDGNQVRITAQLIKVDDGTHLWTESYDRELKGIFAVQEDIAQAIAGALRVPLGLKQGDTLVRNRTDDLESYQQYLRARTLVRARAVSDAIAILEPLVARNPDYAPAWAMLAYTYSLAPTYTPVYRIGSVEEARPVIQSDFDKGEIAARKAMELDSRFALGYAALAQIRGLRMKSVEADGLFHQALALDPTDPEVVHSFRQFLSVAGRLKEALRVSEQLQTLEPFVPNYTLTTAGIMQLNGQSAATIPLIEAVSPDAATSFNRNTRLAMAYAAAGRHVEAADTLLAIRGALGTRQSIEAAARLIRAPSAVTQPENLPRLEGELNFVYAYVGARERVFEHYERNLQIGIFPYPFWLWDPLYAPLRKTERFKALMRNTGLVEYWRVKGWPDLCRPVGADDLVCD
jgi:TolB-like protein